MFQYNTSDPDALKLALDLYDKNRIRLEKMFSKFNGNSTSAATIIRNECIRALEKNLNTIRKEMTPAWALREGHAAEYNNQAGYIDTLKALAGLVEDPMIRLAVPRTAGGMTIPTRFIRAQMAAKGYLKYAVRGGLLIGGAAITGSGLKTAFKGGKMAIQGGMKLTEQGVTKAGITAAQEMIKKGGGMFKNGVVRVCGGSFAIFSSGAGSLYRYAFKNRPAAAPRPAQQP